MFFVEVQFQHAGHFVVWLDGDQQIKQVQLVQPKWSRWPGALDEALLSRYLLQRNKPKGSEWTFFLDDNISSSSLFYLFLR